MKRLKWKLRTFNDIDYNHIDSGLLLREMLKFRGIENPEEWLRVSKEHEHFSSLLKNIDAGIETLHEAITNNKKIYIQVDSDTDGYTSSAMLYRFLKDIARAPIITNIHEGKEHGLNITAALASKADLIIVPDASGKPEDYRKLKDKNIPSIIIDHHTYEEGLFDTTVINCTFEPYPNKSLSGAGVVLKFCQYYCEKYEIDYNFNNLYALCAIGMVADVMSLQELENQFIIRYGLKYIKNHNLFNELLKDRMGNPVDFVTIKNIGWSIGPNLNAVIRLGTMEEKQMLFDTLIAPDENVYSQKRGANGEVVPRYSEMGRICKNLKAKQTRMVQNALKLIEPTINLDHNLICYIDEENALPFELSGLIANKLMSSYKRPTIILRHFHDYENPTFPDCWAGSVRAMSAEGFEEPKTVLSSFGGVRESGGHLNAFALKIYKESIDAFLSEAREKLNKIDFNNQLYIIEAMASVSSFDKNVGKLFAAEDIWGSGIEVPLIKLDDINCLNAEFMGKEKQHVKIPTPNIDIVIFDNPELVETLRQSKKYIMNAIGEISWNEWEDEPRLQLVVSDYELLEKSEDDWGIYDF